MANKRTGVVYETADGAIYVRARKGGHSIYDTRVSPTRERTRRTLDAAIAVADDLARTNPAAGGHQTLAVLAADFFVNGTPELADVELVAHRLASPCGERCAWSGGWQYDQIRRLHKWAAPWLRTRCDDLPDDVLDQVVDAVRKARLSTSTETKVVSLLRAVLVHGQLHGYVDPQRRFVVTRRKRVNKKVRHITNERQVILRSDLPDLASIEAFCSTFATRTGRWFDELMWLLYFFAGPRQSELYARTVADVTYDVGGDRYLIRCDSHIDEDEGPVPVEVPHTKTLLSRTIVVPRFLNAMMARRLAELDAADDLLFPSPKPGVGPRGPSATNAWIRYEWIRYWWLTVGHQIGWPTKRLDKQQRPSSLLWSPHDARHVAATVMCAPRRPNPREGMGLTIKQVAVQLGDHEDTIRNTYLGNHKTAVDDVADNMP